MSRNIPQKEIKALFMLSGGVCAFPDCGKRLIEPGTETDDAAILAEMAHIVGDTITRPFGVLLRSAVATIDEHGLKRRHLMKHAGDVQAFFRRLSEQSFQSEAAEALRQRLVKYKDKLFTFIEHDGVPWNNNNAEHAIKAFARYRECAEGSISEKGLGNHLVLLSLYQSCEYIAPATGKN